MLAWLCATWCATTPTDHFSADVVFFQSASLIRVTASVRAWLLSSNRLARASARAPIAGLRGREDRVLDHTPAYDEPWPILGAAPCPTCSTRSPPATRSASSSWPARNA